MIIRRDEIFVLLNQYLLRNTYEIRVFYPPMEIELFTLNMGRMRLENIVDPKELDRRKRKFATNELLRRELPDSHDLLDVLLSSGVMDFENSEDIEENFDLLRRAVSDRTIYVKPVFIGIDTNIAYYRVVSRRLRNHFRYVLSNVVVGEIDAKIHSKFSGRMLQSLENLPYRNVMREFANGSVKEARRAKNAMNEVNYITNELDAFRIGNASETQDKEKRDREIIRQYRRFSDEINAEVIVLTADKDMVFHAQAEQLSSIYFKLPHRYPSSIEVDATAIPNLIYDLTLIFGIVGVGDTILLGEWRGKSSEDYLEERLKVYNTSPELAKDLEICRGVMREFQGD